MTAIGGHQSAKPRTEDWLTPPAILEALGTFDLDPCASVGQPWPTARSCYTIVDDGLAQTWDGRVWLNPPYTSATLMRWLTRMAEHDHGTALIFARTETEAFCRTVWERAAAVLFIEGRLHFHAGADMTIERPNREPLQLRRGERAPFNAGAPSVLVAYGQTDSEILAFSQIAGQFVPLRFPRSMIVEALSPTWRNALADWLGKQTGAVELSDIYRAFAAHPKAKSNPNWRAKLRQTLQRGAGETFENVGRGRWQMNLAV